MASLFLCGITVKSAKPAALLPSDQIITYQVVEQELPALIEGIARQIGIQAEVSGKVEGRVHGRLPPGTARELLDRLASIYGFEWYYDGRSLHVSAASEAVAKIVPMRKIAAADLLDALVHLGIVDPRWPIRFSRRGDVADIAGPPSYVALVEQTIAAMPEPKTETVADVQIFRGSSASHP